MTAIGTVVIDRTSLSLSSLTIDTDGFSTYYVDVKGLGRPGKTPRETFATDSPFINGRTRTQVVYEESVFVLLVRVNGTSTADLDAKVEALEDALGQFVYPVAVTVDGATKTWTCYPATIQSTDGLLAFERVTSFHEDLSISIPVYPVSA